MKRVIAVIIILSMFLTTMLAGCSYTVTVAESDDGNAAVDIKETTKTDTNVGSTLDDTDLEVPMLESVYKIAKKPEDFAITDRDYLIVVNDDNEYDFDGEYNKALQKDLVFIPNVVDGDVMAVEKATYLAFTLLQRDLLENDGIEIGLYDGYRTAEDQQYLLDVYAEGSNPNVTKGNEIGFSEHHTGLLLDVVVWYSEDTWYSPTEERIKEIPIFKKVYERMADYGFIQRYPSNKADITGRDSKEFEIRFVGSAKIAHEIADNDLCLEEYLKQKQ